MKFIVFPPTRCSYRCTLLKTLLTTSMIVTLITDWNRFTAAAKEYSLMADAALVDIGLQDFRVVHDDGIVHQQLLLEAAHDEVRRNSVSAISP